ncbi:MAG: hypothetical protein B6I20_12085 [Bacteroidetes bacterium 4572_117]|nr:MAG: hypothetical protein B6I20_12085 [Bacteroidetes bacterium 4572_117]
MKKILLYISLFISGIVLGVLLFSDSDLLKILSITDNKDKSNYLAVERPINQDKNAFVQSAMPMLGKDIIVNGVIQEAYKNKEKELVLYVSVSNIPFVVSCELEDTDTQINHPIKLGEMFSIKGKFIEIDERMELENCLVLRREADKDPE